MAVEKVAETLARQKIELISLDREADREVGSVADRIAMGDAQMRRTLALQMGSVFAVANVVTLIAFAVLVWLDETNLRAKLIAPADRIITGNVFMALLGATTVQIGTIAVIMARHLFPSRVR